VPIWIVLMMIYHQHRLERMEALETEQLASRDASAAAIFDERAQDLHVARRRLDRLYKWGLGGVSIVLALYLVIVGGTLFYANYAALQGLSQARSALDDSVASSYAFVRDDFNAVPLIFAGAALFL